MEELKFIKIKPEAIIPERAHRDDAGLDLHAAESAHIGPGERWKVGCGLAIEVPVAHAALVLPRSGLADRHGISLVNAPGLIDPGYRGEIAVLLLNNDPAEIFRVEIGDRIAQLVLIPIATPEPVEVERLSESERGTGGFGSSGT